MMAGFAIRGISAATARKIADRVAITTADDGRDWKADDGLIITSPELIAEAWSRAAASAKHHSGHWPARRRPRWFGGRS